MREYFFKIKAKIAGISIDMVSIPDVLEFWLFKVREYFFKFKAKNAGISIDMASIFNDEINKIGSSLKPKLEYFWYKFQR